MPGPQTARIGEFLRKQGQLTNQQITAILTAQAKSGRPFGDLAQQMYAVSARAVEAAWVEQYLSYGTCVDLDGQQVDPTVLGLLTRRQAWQLQLLPLRREDGRLLVATSHERLTRTVNYAWRRLGQPVVVLVASASQLQQHLQHRYPWPAMRDAQAVGTALAAAMTAE